MQNGDILVPSNPGPPGKAAVKTERIQVTKDYFGKNRQWLQVELIEGNPHHLFVCLQRRNTTVGITLMKF